MSQSMSTPWIRDYLVGVAETYGAQVYNAPAVSKGKKRVQLTDFLTYEEDSYVWAWISDKDYRISVRISKDAIDEYKRRHSRNIIDSRFFLVFIASYRPMFSPRPLGPNTHGNTPESHISLEIGYVSMIGASGHLLGNPCDLESDEKMKEWVLGLRQEDGGGNVLKLRKQQELAQKQKAPPPRLSPPPFSLYAPVSQCQVTKNAEDDAISKPERPHDFKRAYVKRWRRIEVDPWKLAIKPIVEKQSESNGSLVEPRLDTPNGPESCKAKPSPHQTSLRRTPSPSSTTLPQQGTPTNWSPSNRGSPVAPDVTSGNEVQQHDEPDVLPTSHPHSDAEEHAVADTAITSDDHSIPPPTPAQRIKRSPIPRSPSAPCSSPIRSSPLPPSSSLPLPSSSLPVPVGTWRNLQRKVPHPGFPVSRPDSASQGPVQILVPNSDTSSSQLYSQSQHHSQSQAHPLTLSLCLSKEVQPASVSTTKECSSTGRASKVPTKCLPTHGEYDKQKNASSGDKDAIDNVNANMGKQAGSDRTRPPGPSARKVAIFEVGTSDTEEEADVLRLTDTWVEAKLAELSKIQDASEHRADTDDEESQLSVDDADIHSALQGVSQRHSPQQPIQHPSPGKRDVDKVPIQSPTHPPVSPERPGSRGSMHSLFSASFEDELEVSQALTSPEVQEEASPAHVPRHDSEAWKEPSFISKRKGKGKARAVEEPATPSVAGGKKRRRSTQAESPVPKRVKRSQEGRRNALGQTTTNGSAESSSLGKARSSNRPSTSSKGAETAVPLSAAQLSKPRLANFVVDFERINLGKGVPIPKLDLDKDIRRTLLRTGRIRTLGEEEEEDGSVHVYS